MNTFCPTTCPCGRRSIHPGPKRLHAPMEPPSQGQAIAGLQARSQCLLFLLSVLSSSLSLVTVFFLSVSWSREEHPSQAAPWSFTTTRAARRWIASPPPGSSRSRPSRTPRRPAPPSPGLAAPLEPAVVCDLARCCAAGAPSQGPMLKLRHRLTPGMDGSVLPLTVSVSMPTGAPPATKPAAAAEFRKHLECEDLFDYAPFIYFTDSFFFLAGSQLQVQVMRCYDVRAMLV